MADNPMAMAETMASDEPRNSDPHPIYIAKRLADAQRLEEVFTKAGVEYEVQPEEYTGGIIFRGMRVGAFFYVALESWDRAVSVMRENGIRENGFKPTDSNQGK